MTNLSLDDTSAIFKIEKQVSHNKEYQVLKRLTTEEKENLIASSMQSVYQCLFEIDISHNFLDIRRPRFVAKRVAE